MSSAGLTVWRLLHGLLALGLAGWSHTAAPGLREVDRQGSDRQASLIQETQIEFSPWDLVTAIAWSPDGALLAIAAGDSVYIYGSPNWTPITSTRLGALTHGLDFSPDGRWLAAGSRDGTVRLWETAVIVSGAGFGMSQEINAHRKGVNAVRFNPQEAQLASGGNDAIARFWGAPAGEALGMTIGGSFAVPSIDFSLDGQVLAVVNGEMIRLRETSSERIVGTFLSTAPLYSVEFSPNGEEIAATGNDNLIRIWRTDQAYRTAQPVYSEPRLLVGHNGREGTFRALVWKAVYSPDGRLLISAGGDGTIRLWEAQSGTLIASYRAHPGGATSLAFHPSGSQIASGGLDSRVIIWSLRP